MFTSELCTRRFLSFNFTVCVKLSWRAFAEVGGPPLESCDALKSEHTMA